MKIKFAIIIYFSFILFTIIGTLSHEFGHFIVGRYLGYDSEIHFGFTSWGDNANLDGKMEVIYQRNNEAIMAKSNYAEKSEMLKLFQINTRNHFWMTFGGPFQTIFSGTIGVLLILYIRKRHLYASKLSHWLCLFLALFWLRQPANLISWILSKPFNGRYSTSADEIRLTQYLELPQSSIIWVTGVLGLILGGYSILTFVPKDKLITFCISGFLGGVSGYILWLKIIGPIVLP